MFLVSISTLNYENKNETTKMIVINIQVNKIREKIVCTGVNTNSLVATLYPTSQKNEVVPRNVLNTKYNKANING